MEDLVMTYEDDDGTVKFLPGYMFDPTDDVLVEFYLKRRVFGQRLPVQIISDFDVFQTEPWSLPRGDRNIFNERKLFFNNTMGRDLENIDKRVAGNGQWRVIEKAKCVPIPGNNEMANWAVYRIFQNNDEKKLMNIKGSNMESSNTESDIFSQPPPITP
ncbi:NAC domain-containing protein 2-like [Lotus japonicus]|uniref:NAC domain-containing protein 2-like n=1 Tax=Lotus japonicus TaxID=34305 RepID=UPI002582E3D4|nr:NAC domain-containing protein 2-like [Lotus japonicus]